MTEMNRNCPRIKFCGLSRPEDILEANRLKPEYIGFVFYEKSSRCVTQETAARLKALLSLDIRAVGVFVDAPIKEVAMLLESGVIDLAQLHGSENEAYLRDLRKLTKKPLIKAFKVRGPEDLEKAEACTADLILLDAGQGGGQPFDWTLLKDFSRPYFLAGGLAPGNAGEAVRLLHPFALDVSSGIEAAGKKAPEKMAAFLAAVKNA